MLSVRIGLILLLFAAFASSGLAQSGTGEMIISTVAGNGTAGFNGDGASATAAQLHGPYRCATDSAGNLYIADFNNNRIRKVTTGGVISTVVGSGAMGSGGDGGRAIDAQLDGPAGIAIDSSGNLYFADLNNQRIRKVTAAGIISTVAGGGVGGLNGPATDAQLVAPVDVAVNSSGILYIADRGANQVLGVATDGTISAIAGDGIAGFSGDGNLSPGARLNQPSGVAMDSTGNLYIADAGNNRIRKITPAGMISTVAGGQVGGFGGDGGPAFSAQLNTPVDLAFDPADNFYIADMGNARIREVTAGGVISTLSGDGTAGFSGDGGPASAAEFDGVTGVATDPVGNIYIADLNNQRIREVVVITNTSTYFPQIVVGGGYTTQFAITNTGSSTASASLIIKDPYANPLPVNGTLTDSSGVTQAASLANTFNFTVPAGGTVFLSTTLAASSYSRGWVQLVSTGGSLTGVATYRAGSIMVGVLNSQPLQYATIPVNNDTTQGTQTAYAIANPGSQPILIKLALVGQDGTLVDDTFSITLSPGQQIADYLWQDLGSSRKNFKGSMVLRGQSGATYVVVSLLDNNQGLYFTVIPIISGKAFQVPN